MARECPRERKEFCFELFKRISKTEDFVGICYTSVCSLCKPQAQTLTVSADAKFSIFVVAKSDRDLGPMERLGVFISRSRAPLPARLCSREERSVFGTLWLPGQESLPPAQCSSRPLPTPQPPLG